MTLAASRSQFHPASSSASAPQGGMTLTTSSAAAASSATADTVHARAGWRRIAFVAAGALWIVSILAGATVLMCWGAGPGVAAAAPTHWPDDVAIARRDGVPALVVFAHPQCPCTRATLAELDKILARCNGRVQSTVVFLSLDELGEEWTKGEMWNLASALTGVAVMADADGALAKRFCVATSGQALLYGADGALQFTGGITAGRGHAGDNLGEDAVIAHVLGAAGAQDAAAVYGCGMFVCPDQTGEETR